MPVLSYPAAFARLVAAAPSRLALVFEGQEVSRGELDAQANRLARAYADHGVSPGDRVMIALPNSVEFIAATFAVWKLGAVPAPLSARLPEAEQREIVALADPRLVLGVEEGTYSERACLPAGFAPSVAISDAPLPDQTAPHSQVIASGGSTGRPKLIVDANPAAFDTDKPHYGIGPDVPVLIPGPLFHTGPFINTREALLRGGVVILMGRFDPEEAVRLIEAHRVQWVNFVPTMLHRIWRLPDEIKKNADLSSLQRVVSTGAACADWLMRAWIEWIGPDQMFEAYGGTERIGGTLISGREWLEHPGSVGKPTGGRKVRIVGTEGETLPAGEIGEVFMLPPGGQGSTYSYVGATAKATGDGWETLGDLGYQDADGFLYLVDRRTDMIVTGGENVYPAEVEGAIDAHPSVHSSAVIGLPDEDLGARIHAIIEADPPVSEEVLRAHLAERLVRYKIPRSFEFVQEPLRDDAGKLRRSQLRDQRIS
ncbi:MAG: AMP-binding protein [Deltaproteobacteria bacterium]|nr:AMP-binding protein [Deltaproteobacteria bacterium]MBW2396441.1 AMP-binding protein [Deltaproteobacteria bacterium]